MCRKPVITAPAHSGMAILRFMDSWVVGVNVCGKRPRRFVDPINMIRETIIRVHVRPFGVWISIICLIISLTSQCWKEWRRSSSLPLSVWSLRGSMRPPTTAS